MARFDDMNVTRITAGLDQAADTLMDLEPAERSISALPTAEMYALFESMHCTPFLASEELLQAHFDKPFRLVQTKRKIALAEYTPAMGSFLFSKNEYRLAWALRGWKKFRRPISAAEFNWAVRDTLIAAGGHIKTYGSSAESLSIFWRGVHTIVEKLTKDIITHHFRGMNLDIYMLAYENLHSDFDGYTDLVSTVQLLLQLSPSDFWDALGAIPPQSVAAEPFKSPFLNRHMMTVQPENTNLLELLLQWISPFIGSIKATNLAPACRAIVNQLMSRSKDNSCTIHARSLCWQKGLQTMVKTLQIMEQTSAGSAIVTDLLEIVRDHVHQVLEDIEGYKDLPEHVNERKLGLDLIRCALSLDCHSLARTRQELLQGKSLGHDLNISSLTIWKAATRAVRPRNITLASAILIGVRDIVVYEPLTAKQSAASPKQAQAWNDGFNRASTYVRDLLETLQDFDSTELLQLLKTPESAQAFFAATFSGHAEIQQSAATILKAMASAETRRDGIKYLLDRFFVISLNSISEVLNTIARLRLFAPCRTLLKIGNDMLDSLCSPQDGILRSRTLSAEDIVATETVWQSLWTVVGNIFNYTEMWSLQGQDKNMMVEFCRDAMDFADQAFDQYSVITGALHDANGAAAGSTLEDTQRQLLQSPRAASGHVTKWLRLRDEYLIAKAISLTCRIMGRLRDVDLQLPEESTFFVDDIVSGTARNRLSIGQKAELRRALENHLGQEPEASSSDLEFQKPQKQGSLSSWVTSGPSAGLTTVVQEKPKKGLDMDAWRSSAQARNEDLKKAISNASPAAQALKSKVDFLGSKSVKKAAQPPAPSPSDFRLRRQQEQEAMRKRNLAIIAAERAKAGLGEAGSGLSGIGIEGKDHSARGEGVMVSSDESSDDEDGGFDAELFGVSKPAKRANTLKNDLAGVVGLKPEQRGPVKLQRQIRSAKDMRARLAPDLSPLHKTILGWDYFHEGQLPPNSSDWQYKKVANSFRHIGDYQDTFRPLLTLEAWNGFVKSKEENNNKPYEIKIGSRSSVDAFLEIGSSVSHADNREMHISESDIVLFSTDPKPTANADAPHCLARVYRVRRQKQHLEITYRVMPNSNMMPHLKPNNILHGMKIQSLTPLEREYGALLGLQYYDLCDEIIKARPSPLLNYTEKQLQPLIDNYTVNKAQAKAIRSAIDNDAFTLIQGPPGSGKTKTIVGIVGALLTDTLSEKQGVTRIQVPKAAGTNQPSVPMTSKKLLVCAPSNAAVDELVMRFKAGIKTLKGVHKEVKVVRLGRSDAINTNVADVTMDELVKKRLGQSNDGDKDAREKTQQLFKEHQAVSEQVRNARAKLDSGEVKGKEASILQDEFNVLRRRKTQLGNQIDNAKDAESTAGRTQELNRKRVQQSILDEAHVICATLSGSGHDMFQSLNIEFETVIIDEAAQCVEMGALIPLKYGCAKCILVGDPKQLPPTVLSRQAASMKFEQSLFVRMQDNFPDAVHLLDTQYRMHPDISAFPSASFYGGKLLDGDDMAGLRRRPWHSSDLLAPYRFYDVEGKHQAARTGHSLINLAEVDVALGLYNRLTKDYPDFDWKNNIGIITPYKSQLRELKQRFASQYGESILDVIDFNTTDAFQGRESEVIIFSCVRASQNGSIGFLDDIRRMNVGITRAKSSLYILGNSHNLSRGEYWEKLLVDARQRGCFIAGDIPSKLRQHSSKFPANIQVKKENAINPERTDGLSKTRSDGRSSLVVKTEPVEVDHDDDAMEGVKVKLEDRLQGMRSGLTSRRVSPGESEDAEMRDAGTSTSSDGTPITATSVVIHDEARSETLALDGNKKSTPADGVAPKTKTQPAPGKAPPPIIRKRKPADPFMPRKQQKRS
ncbi:SEN1 N terminal-domain-containing protein [Delphinella strobiligena]|nr:SEN1 N terminal-domain-containing protein [Delphinella strobiligena]